MKQGKTVRGMEIIFSGVVEVYNTSGRANAIKSYEFFYRGGDGSWKEMESRRYEVSPDIYNATPLAVAPYSGTEWKVMAFSWHEQRPFDLDILIAVEDLFGKRSTVIVKARA